jgi:hypothetical protein
VHDELADPAAQGRIARDLHAEAMRAMSVTRDNETVVTSERQLRILEDTARRIMSMRLDDEPINGAAASMLEHAAIARRWTWVNPLAAAVLAVVGVAVGVGAAVLGGTSDNMVLAVIGGLLGSALLGVVVLRYRRENWRIKAEKIAPMIWRPGL